ncbi:MAG: purine-nucleoside phosphorylase [Bacilli bacterium]|nr:purine-nucleoside phosphorylase [Bacilli bacterium]
MTPHIEAEKNQIAKTVIMPGDPLRAKLIAENFLDDCKLVNKVRNIYAYTGKYKGKEITVMASGMGMPSIGIYAYELFTVYDVDTIIRIGSSGALSQNLNLFDIVLSNEACTYSNYAKTTSGEDIHIAYPNKQLNEQIIKTAKDLNKTLVVGKTLTSDIFDIYALNKDYFESTIPADALACEMEAFALFFLAEKLNKKAACLMTVVDSKFTNKQATAEDREKHLSDMIKITLESIK